jgi:SAM-dependent methyltransferase
MHTVVSLADALKPYLLPDVCFSLSVDNLPTCDIPHLSPSMEANRYFFGHPDWRKGYPETINRHGRFRERWQAATGSWDDKVIVDIGCGSGDLFAAVGGSPKVLIGVDISPGALQMAQEIGYTPLLADAQNLPLKDGFADLVIANAAIHHCDDMARVLAEAARLVKPGGLLVTDEDSQSTARNYQGFGLWLERIALFLREVRFLGYWIFRSPYYMPRALRKVQDATEAHNSKPGDGVTPELYCNVLQPLGFEVKVFPHNHNLGAEVLQGQIGRMSWRVRLPQKLSGINPNAPEAAVSIMCVAKRR